MINPVSKFFESLKAKSRGAAGAAPAEFSRALDLGRTRLLFLEGRPSHGKLYLNQFTHIPLSLDVPLVNGLKVLFEEKKCEKDSLRISLKSPQVVIRFLRFPKMNEKELRGVLQYEIEQYVPYEAKDLYLDLAVLQESVKTDAGENTEIFVAVAKKDYLDALIKQFQDVQSVIDVVDVDILACMKCLEFFHPDEFSGHVAILDIGVHVTTLGVIRGGQPRFIRDLSFGSQDISKKLKNRANLSDMDTQDFLDGKTTVAEAQAPVFLDSIEGLINDVKVSFDYYRDQSEDGAGADCLFVCGVGSAQDFILKALGKALDVPIKNMDLISKIELGPNVSPELLSAWIYDLPVGLGLILPDHD